LLVRWMVTAAARTATGFNSLSSLVGTRSTRGDEQ